LTTAELREFLRQPWNARLATVTNEARPYLTPVWDAYQEEPTCFFVVARKRATFIEHIRYNPAVALHIADDHHLEHTRALVEGMAKVADEAVAPEKDALLRDLVNNMAIRYMGPDGPSYVVKTLDRPRLLITI